MKKTRKILCGSFSFLILLSAFTSPAMAKIIHERSRKQPFHFHKNHHKKQRHPYYGIRISFPRFIAKTIFNEGIKYYYHEGYFYKKNPFGYIIVDGPIGSIVTKLPKNHTIVVIKGRKYFYFNDIYYIKDNRGYVVVKNPVHDIQNITSEIVLLNNPYQQEIKNVDHQNEFTVNIPNGDGTFTSIYLERTKNGYLGPQGELYNDFPNVSQLKAMYGK